MPVAAVDLPEEDEDEAGLIWHAVGAALAVMAVSYIGACLPLWLRHVRESIIDGSNAFGAGGFWGLGLTHVLLESTDMCKSLNIGIEFASGSFLNGVYPLALLGFVIMLWVESYLAYFVPTIAKLEEKPQEKPWEDDYVTAEEAVTDSDTKAAEGSIVSVCIAAAGLTVHAFMEGLVVGMRDEASLIWIAAVSVMLHKWAVCFSVATTLKKNGIRTCTYWTIMSSFIVISTISIIVGRFIGNAESKSTAVINAISTGIILYVASELTRDIFNSQKIATWSLLKTSLTLVSLTAGAALIFGVTCLHLANPGGHVHV